MLIKSALNFITENLKSVSEFPQIESKIILSEVLNKSIEHILINSDYKINRNDLLKIKRIIAKRNTNTPLEHILKFKYFYNDRFFVNNNVLIPRSETEVLVDLAINSITNHLESSAKISIGEIGLGSGCISISVIKSILNINKEIEVTFVSTDISKKALEVAIKNASTLLGNFIESRQAYSKHNQYFQIQSKNVKVNFFILNADVLTPLNARFLDLISSHMFNLLISNPPYLDSKSMSKLNKDVKREPLIALDGGKNGTDIIERILVGTRKAMHTNGEYIFEIDECNVKQLNLLVENLGLNKPQYKTDLTSRTRYCQIIL